MSKLAEEGGVMIGADIDLLRWLHMRLKSGEFSLSNADDCKAVDWLGVIVKHLEAEQAKVPGPSQPPRNPFSRDWA